MNVNSIIFIIFFLIHRSYLKTTFPETTMDNQQNNWKTIFFLTESFNVEGIHAIFEVSHFKKLIFKSNFQAHIHILRQNDWIMVHQRLRRNNMELHRNITVHSCNEIYPNQETTLAKLDEDTQLTHKGKRLQVC